VKLICTEHVHVKSSIRISQLTQSFFITTDQSANVANPDNYTKNKKHVSQPMGHKALEGLGGQLGGAWGVVSAGW